MKFIATRSFSQGLRNPLNIIGGKQHIEKGTVISLGEKELAHKDVKVILDIGCLVPLESQKGADLQVELTHTAVIEKERIPKPKTDWNRAGAIIGLAGLAAAALASLIWWLVH